MVNYLYKNDRFLFWESYETHNYICELNTQLYLLQQAVQKGTTLL